MCWHRNEKLGKQMKNCCMGLYAARRQNGAGSMDGLFFHWVRTMRTVCCVCQRTKSHNGWVKQSVLRRADDSHGYCPDCYRKTLEMIEISATPARLMNRLFMGLK